jgi:hypothetical protein
MFVLMPSLSGCSERIDDYMSAASISANGFALDGETMRQEEGQTIRLLGFVDHANLYGNAGARLILGDWWSGEGPGAAAWRFNLKANGDDKAGRSFPVLVADDPGRDALLKKFMADAQAGRPTRVFVKGRLFTFAAPTQAGLLTGLYLKVDSSQDIRLKPTEVH